jgi:hypothetical protein
MKEFKNASEETEGEVEKQWNVGQARVTLESEKGGEEVKDAVKGSERVPPERTEGACFGNGVDTRVGEEQEAESGEKGDEPDIVKTVRRGEHDEVSPESAYEETDPEKQERFAKHNY